MGKSKKRTIRGTHIVSSSLCTPAVRTVIVTVHIFDDGTFERQVIPVVAIESRIVEVYEKCTMDNGEYGLEASTRRVLKDRGYRFQYRDIQTLLVHAHSDYGLISSKDGDPGENGLAEVAVCPWPEKDDEERLEDLFKELEEGLQQRVKLGFFRHIRSASPSQTSLEGEIEGTANQTDKK